MLIVTESFQYLQRRNYYSKYNNVHQIENLEINDLYYELLNHFKDVIRPSYQTLSMHTEQVSPSNYWLIMYANHQRAKPVYWVNASSKGSKLLNVISDEWLHNIYYNISNLFELIHCNVSNLLTQTTHEVSIWLQLGEESTPSSRELC